MWELIKEKKKLIIWVSIIVTTILILLPLLIEWKNPKYITAGDALTFWGAIGGAIIGATVAIAGVYLTFNHNQKMMTEERKLNVLPVVAVNYTLKDKKEKIKELIENKNDIKKFIVNFTDKSIIYRFQLEDSMVDIGTYSSCYMTFMNIGVSTAVNFSLEFTGNYKKKIDGIMNKINLKPMQDFELYIFFEKPKYMIIDGMLKFEYSDIYGNGYYQEHPITYNLEKDILIIDTAINQKTKQG